MPLLLTEYSSGHQGPELLQRDLGGTLTCPVYYQGALVTPTGGTCALKDSAGTSRVTPAVTVPATIARAAFSTTDLAALSYGMGYRVYWRLTFADGTRDFQTEVGIVRWAPSCPISDANLLARRSNLARLLRGTGEESFQKWITEAWRQCQRWLSRQAGNRAHLAVNQDELVELLVAWTLCNLYQEMAENADPEGIYRTAYLDWRETLKNEKDDLVLTYDADDDGLPDEVKRRGQAPVMTGGFTAQRW